MKDERTNILGERIHNEAWPIPDPNNIHESRMEKIKKLLGIGKELEEKEWKLRMELAGKMFEVRRKTYKDKAKIVKECTNVVYIVITQEVNENGVIADTENAK